MVYASESAALAALEMLVHLGKGATLPAYVVIPCTFDDSLVKVIEPRTLPAGWRSYPAPPGLQVIGNAWVNENESAVLKVPSVVVATEFNYLLNPRHREFEEITIGRPQSFQFDLRLLS